MKIIYINKLLTTILPIFLILAACTSKPDFNSNDKVVQEIVENNTDSVEVGQYFPDKDVRNFLHNEFNEFYKARNYKLAWLTFDEPTAEADELLQSLDSAHQEGMSPEHYNVNEIESLLKELYDIDSRKERRKDYRKAFKSKKYKNELKESDTVLFQKIVRLDFLMTASYLTYASHLLQGKISPNETAAWYSEPRKKDLSAHLENALENKNIHQSLLALNPPHPQYERLKEKLTKYREYSKKGNWDKYNISSNLNLKDKGRDVINLKQRLSMEGIYSGDVNDSLFDDQLATAVKLYQSLQGLGVTGRVDDKTRKSLNTPLEEVIQKIAFNMERMRWIHGPFGDHYVLVNIPAFQMKVIKDEKPVVQMKAIVGEKVNKTPVFNDSLEYIVFSPEWNVPRSIAVNEMLPQIKKNPTYLRDRNYRLYESWADDAKELSQQSVNWDEVDSSNFNFRIVENPSAKNSLGKVKFIFPNDNSIYLHDTPADHLFSQNERDFSHGCIRLEKPAQFAQYLLSDKGWDENEVNEYMNKTEPATILLKEKLPVYIVYWTAWVDEENNHLHMRNDIYNYDKSQMKQLKDKEEELKEKEIKIDA